MAQRLVRRLEVPRHRVELIPQGLRVDDQPLARHHPHLPFEREMIGVLRDSDGDAEGGRVAASGDHLCGAWRGDHGAVTRTAVLLADVMLDLVRQLHRRDAVGLFGLAGHLGQLAAARRTRPLVRRQLVPHLHGRQRRLRPRPVAGLRRTGRRRGRCAGGGQHLRTTLLERAQFRERELLGIRHAAQPCELRGQLQGLRDEALILAVEEETNLPQGVDIAFLRQVDHALRIGSSRAIRGKRKLRHRRGR